MAYKKFATNFTLNDQIVYEIITNQFTPIMISVAAHLTHFCASYLSLCYHRRADFTKFISLTFFF